MRSPAAELLVIYYSFIVGFKECPKKNTGVLKRAWTDLHHLMATLSGHRYTLSSNYGADSSLRFGTTTAQI